jgi:hypothetical protein
MKAMCASDILFVGNDLAKLKAASKMFRTPGTRFVAVFHDDLFKTDYAMGRFGAVIICDSVPKESKDTIWAVLHDAQPEVPIYVMWSEETKPDEWREVHVTGQMNDAEDPSTLSTGRRP